MLQLSQLHRVSLPGLRMYHTNKHFRKSSPNKLRGESSTPATSEIEFSVT